VKTAPGGFTLVETLVALAIMAVVCVTIVSAVSGLMTHVPAYNEQTQIILLARALAAELEARGLPEERSGFFENHQDYSWALAEGPVTEEEEAEEKTWDTPQTRSREHLLTVTAPSGRSLDFRVILPPS